MIDPHKAGGLKLSIAGERFQVVAVGHQMIHHPFFGDINSEVSSGELELPVKGEDQSFFWMLSSSFMNSS